MRKLGKFTVTGPDGADELPGSLDSSSWTGWSIVNPVIIIIFLIF